MVTHRRIRPFNTRDTYPEQNLDNDLCQAVVANGVVYLRGQIGQDLDTRENVGVGDVAVQTEKAMSNIAMLLSEAGSCLEDIVKVTVYIVDPRYREPVYRTMGKWLRGVFPVSTGIVVQALARPEWLVEIDATAVISDEPRPTTAPSPGDSHYRQARHAGALSVDNVIQVGPNISQRPEAGTQPRTTVSRPEDEGA